jgi:hypothetical protein
MGLRHSFCILATLELLLGTAILIYETHYLTGSSVLLWGIFALGIIGLKHRQNGNKIVLNNT